MNKKIHEVNQWGRKDPFTPSSATINAEVQIYTAGGTAITKGTNGISGKPDEEFKLDNTIKTTINHLIQNPSTHYTKENNTEGNYVPIVNSEYYDITEEGDWWNPTIKTLYDPCPNGYRIPKSGTYGVVSDWILSTWTSGTLTEGHIWNQNTKSFFPISGSRLATNGKFYAVGTNGYYWMSTPHSPPYARSLRISTASLTTNGTHVRSDNFFTRCIKD